VQATPTPRANNNNNNNNNNNVILRGEHRLRVSENRALRRIFGRKKEEVAGGWRRLHNEELHDF
jgi:hypothetical protein